MCEGAKDTQEGEIYERAGGTGKRECGGTDNKDMKKGNGDNF